MNTEQMLCRMMLALLRGLLQQALGKDDMLSYFTMPEANRIMRELLASHHHVDDASLAFRLHVVATICSDAISEARTAILEDHGINDLPRQIDESHDRIHALLAQLPARHQRAVDAHVELQFGRYPHSLPAVDPTILAPSPYPDPSPPALSDR